MQLYSIHNNPRWYDIEGCYYCSKPYEIKISMHVQFWTNFCKQISNSATFQYLKIKFIFQDSDIFFKIMKRTEKYQNI